MVRIDSLVQSANSKEKKTGWKPGNYRNTHRLNHREPEGGNKSYGYGSSTYF